MRLLQRLLFAFIDTFLAWFTPTWRKEGHIVASNTKRYLNHFEDKITAERYEELASPLKELKAALNSWDKENTKRLSLLITTRAEGRLGYNRPALVEMVESIFVIMVVFLALRTYYAQPFRIPTGSMQPSLNGIIIHPVDEIPSLPERMLNMVTKGSSYVDIVANSPKTIVGLNSKTKWLLFMETEIQFDDGSRATVPSAPGAVMEYLQTVGKSKTTPQGTFLGHFKAGEVVIRGRADAGDMVLVNRVAYHFRKPERGECFVFDTRGIQTSTTAKKLNDQSAGTHYIKRLAALPGDSIQLEKPHLLINGEIAKEATFKRVMDRQSPYNPAGYHAISRTLYPLGFLTEGTERTLSTSPPNSNLKEYVALGDNTLNSLDSRYWGPVHQFNVLGPAFLVLWPFTSHWGLIP